MKRINHSYTIEELKFIVAESFSYAECLRKFNIPVHGNAYTTLKSRIKQHDIDISHFTGALWSKGKTLDYKPKYSTEDIFSNKVPYYNGSRLRKRLTEEGYFENKCYSCNLTAWLGSPIPLELEHKNGDHYDNRLENLTVLCPNCHAKTETYCGKNRVHEKSKWEDTTRKISKSLKSKNCPTCSIEYQPRRDKQIYCSTKCSHKNLEIMSIEDLEKLKSLIWKLPKTKLGTIFNVSDRTIINWCKKYNILTPPRGYFINKKDLN